MTEDQKTNSEAIEEQVPEFHIQRIYVKDISFESPNAPEIFEQEWQPKLNLNLENAINQLDDKNYEVVLTLSLKSVLGENENVAFICEMQQAGIFYIDGLEGIQLSHCLLSNCPKILFPYARALIANLVSQGTFPQLNLEHIDFDQLFMQHLQEQEKLASEQAEDTTETPSTH